jgi:hypothetical protein
MRIEQDLHGSTPNAAAISELPLTIPDELGPAAHRLVR